MKEKSFNEAAGIPRGRRQNDLDCLDLRCRRFNEAAGIPRGRPSDTRAAPGAPSLASMRPRVFPAEDTAPSEFYLVTISKASMRPRVFPAEDAYKWFEVRTGTRLQ